MASEKSIEIEKLKPQFDFIISDWGLNKREREKKKITIEEWLENFDDPYEIKYAFKVIKGVKSPFDLC